MIPPGGFLILSLILFVFGVIAFFVKKDFLTMFMAVEIMLNAANLAFLALSKWRGFPLDGQVIVFFIMSVAAAEAVVGLAIIRLVYRRRKTVRAGDWHRLKG